MTGIPAETQLYEMQKTMKEMRQLHWANHELFTLQWFLLIAIVIIPWLIFWKFADRKRINEILLYGFFVIVLSILLDDIGSHLQFWSYHYNLTPLVHQLGPINLSILPVSYMLIYQYFSSLKAFFIVHVIFSTGGSFIVEPFFEKIGIYVQYQWKHIYSFPIYILMAIVLKWVMGKIKNWSVKGD